MNLRKPKIAPLSLSDAIKISSFNDEKSTSRVQFTKVVIHFAFSYFEKYADMVAYIAKRFKENYGGNSWNCLIFRRHIRGAMHFSSYTPRIVILYKNYKIIIWNS